MPFPSSSSTWANPAHEFSLCPFWFWNDRLEDDEIRRQIADFEAHGVHQFVLHPRIGLPRDIGWMSPRYLAHVRVAVEEAARRGMHIILYDEGMYPSGSSSGRVVAENPDYAARGFVAVDGCATAHEALARFAPADDAELVAFFPDLQPSLAVVCCRSHGVVRGLHYRDGFDDAPAHSDGFDETPPAADLLNPDAMACFIRHSYDTYHAALAPWFGTTVRGFFTDEPSFIGRGDPALLKPFRPGTRCTLRAVERILGHDFTPSLPALWRDDFPDAARHRADYHRAIDERLNETYYEPLARWCRAHGVALAGHPDRPDRLAPMRYFDIPGQDVVWRWVEPWKASGLTGPESTSAKAASSIMVHEGRRRNANEFAGAYGMNLTFDELRALAGWLLVRGCNLLIPHAFLYSMRGPRATERPPDVGPNSPWWSEFRPFADACRRLSWLNTDSTPVLDVAILAHDHGLPWAAAKVCFEHQIDFHYLDATDLAKAEITSDAVIIAGQRYRAVVADGPRPDSAALARLQGWSGLVSFPENADPAALVSALDARSSHPAWPARHPALRVRRVFRENHDYVLLFNEHTHPITVPASALERWPEHCNAHTGEIHLATPEPLTLSPWAWHVRRNRR